MKYPKPPEKIWLQFWGDLTPEEIGEQTPGDYDITWADDWIYQSDCEYVQHPAPKFITNPPTNKPPSVLWLHRITPLDVRGRHRCEGEEHQVGEFYAMLDPQKKREGDVPYVRADLLQPPKRQPRPLRPEAGTGGDNRFVTRPG